MIISNNLKKSKNLKYIWLFVYKFSCNTGSTFLMKNAYKFIMIDNALEKDIMTGTSLPDNIYLQQCYYYNDEITKI